MYKWLGISFANLAPMTEKKIPTNFSIILVVNIGFRVKMPFGFVN